MTTTERTSAATQGAAEEAPVRVARSRLSEGKKAERRLGWLLCAPAAIVMLAVTAYPILYAL
ncbi:MAG TPA: ABC transporter permease, partial [Micromonosporaceae bacterium]|nr:ABC transporter permease [Micromonosporaceae bacterium]